MKDENGKSVCAVCAGKGKNPVPTLTKTGDSFFKSEQPEPVWREIGNIWEKKKSYYNKFEGPVTIAGAVMLCNSCGTLQPA